MRKGKMSRRCSPRGKQPASGLRYRIAQRISRAEYAAEAAYAEAAPRGAEIPGRPRAEALWEARIRATLAQVAGTRFGAALSWYV